MLEEVSAWGLNVDCDHSSFCFLLQRSVGSNKLCLSWWTFLMQMDVGGHPSTSGEKLILELQAYGGKVSLISSFVKWS
jgi:hypothetical protein